MFPKIWRTIAAAIGREMLFVIGLAGTMGGGYLTARIGIGAWPGALVATLVLGVLLPAIREAIKEGFEAGDDD